MTLFTGIRSSYSLQDVQDQLQGLVGKSIPEKRAFIERVTSQEQFPLMIGAILEDRQLLQEIADRSFPHKNGFDLLKLFKTKDYDFRAHIWDKSKDNQENPHSHRWDVISRILVGTLNQDFFKLVDEHPVQRTFLTHPEIRNDALARGQASETEVVPLIERKRFMCQPNKSYHKEQDEVRRTFPYVIDQVTEEGREDYLLRQLTEAPFTQVQAGNSYGLDRSIIHRIVRKKGDGMTATLMMNTAPHTPASRVFSMRDLTTDDECDAVTFTVDEVISKLKNLLSKYQDAN